MKKFFSDFKKFITKGNILDLAVAVIIGGAFGKIVTSLVNDMLMPLIGLAIGDKGLADLTWEIVPADVDAGIKGAYLNYGLFIQSIIDFLVIALCIFLIIRIVMRSRTLFAESKKKIKAGIIDSEEKKELRDNNIDPSDRKAAIAYFEEKEAKAKLEEEKRAAEAAAAAAEAAEKEREVYESLDYETKLLVQIRDLLKK